jgi:hypothetical protein
MVGVDGSSPFAPTKIGREIKHLAAMPGAFFLAAPKSHQFVANTECGGAQPSLLGYPHSRQLNLLGGWLRIQVKRSIHHCTVMKPASHQQALNQTIEFGPPQGRASGVAPGGLQKHSQALACCRMRDRGGATCPWAAFTQTRKDQGELLASSLAVARLNRLQHQVPTRLWAVKAVASVALPSGKAWVVYEVGPVCQPAVGGRACAGSNWRQGSVLCMAKACAQRGACAYDEVTFVHSMPHF